MKKIKVGDIVIIAVILLMTTGVFGFRFFQYGNGEKAAISAGGEKTVYSLNEDRKIDIENNGISLTVVIEDGKAYVEKSDCKGNDCVKMGEISQKGDMIACVPAKVFVKIIGEGKKDYDYVIG